MPGDRRSRPARRGDDPIRPVAEALTEEAWVLCFDRFAVSISDIADAMILGRLFTALFEHGVVVVATSNVEPRHLYEGGLNRALFLPFIKLLRNAWTWCASTPERISGSKAGGQPGLPRSRRRARRAALDEAFHKLTGRRGGEPAQLTVKGRIVEVPDAAGGVAQFSFADLCASPSARPTTSPSRRISTRSSSMTSPAWGSIVATRRNASSSSSTRSTRPTSSSWPRRRPSRGTSTGRRPGARPSNSTARRRASSRCARRNTCRCP